MCLYIYIYYFSYIYIYLYIFSYLYIFVYVFIYLIICCFIIFTCWCCCFRGRAFTMPWGGMESVVSLVVGLADDCQDDGVKRLVEEACALNFTWMLDVEESVEAWTETGKDKDEDDCDGSCVEIGEENMDRLGEKIDEDGFMHCQIEKS